jgi:mannose-6-phosphate isomerase
MGDLYPLLMLPIFDPRPWGTRDLSPIYPNHRFAEKIGEAWLTAGPSKVANGWLRGQSLASLSAEYGRELVGESAPHPARFPLLVKFLFPCEKLSVQVHPDDETARGLGQVCGKTECWYVAHAQPSAQVAIGLKPGVTRAQFEHSIQQERAEELLNWVEVRSGEMIYIAGGTVHTLGPGSIIVETQQPSDITYRLYDYGRPRELHLRDGFCALKEKVGSGKVIRPAPTKIDGEQNQCWPLLASPYFVVELFELNQPYELRARSGKRSTQILVVTEGCGVIESESFEPVTVATGDAVVVPASLDGVRVRPQWSIGLLKSSLPDQKVPEPVTEL